MSRLFFFNPDCELAIANGSKYYMPPANIVRMKEELSFLPAYMAANGDYILTKERAGVVFKQSRKNIFNMDYREVVWEELNGLPIEAVEPWGWSPQVCHLLGNLEGVEKWTPERKELYSRKKAQECLEKLLLLLPFVEKNILSQVCFSMAEIEKCVSNGKYIVKAPWSSSGKGLLMVEGTLAVKEKEWLGGMLRRQGYLMVEKLLDKTYDFAMEFYSDGQKVDFIGFSEFYTGESGEYRGNYVGPQQHIRKRLAEYLEEAVFNDLKKQITKTLSGLLSPDYKGYFGVDLMIYRNDSGNFCLQPCIEINLRYNMGIVALFLSRTYLSSKTSGVFSILFFPEAGEAYAYHLCQQERFPLVYRDGQIVSGYINLTPVNTTTGFIAELLCTV